MKAITFTDTNGYPVVAWTGSIFKGEGDPHEIIRIALYVVTFASAVFGSFAIFTSVPLSWAAWGLLSFVLVPPAVIWLFAALNVYFVMPMYARVRSSRRPFSDLLDAPHWQMLVSEGTFPSSVQEKLTNQLFPKMVAHLCVSKMWFTIAPDGSLLANFYMIITRMMRSPIEHFHQCHVANIELNRKGYSEFYSLSGPTQGMVIIAKTITGTYVAVAHFFNDEMGYAIAIPDALRKACDEAARLHAAQSEYIGGEIGPSRSSPFADGGLPDRL